MSFNFTTVKKLYKGEFRYNIVLLLADGDVFKGQDKSKYTQRLEILSNTVLFVKLRERQQEHRDALYLLYEYIMNMENFATRVSLPYLTIYTNNYNDITLIRELIPRFVESIGLPPEGLKPGMVYMPDTHYDYRVTINEITSLNEEFVEWVDNTDKVKLQSRTRNLLSNKNSRHVKSGAQLYVNGERNLAFVKMHLGNAKLSIDRILN